MSLVIFYNHKDFETILDFEYKILHNVEKVINLKRSNLQSRSVCKNGLPVDIGYVRQHSS